MSHEYNRNIRDVKNSVTAALPAANATSRSPSIDLGQRIGGEIESIDFELVIPACPALAASKNATFSLHDSEDDSTFAAVNPSITTSVVGVSTDGSAAKTIRFRLNPSTRRYIAISASVDDDGGDNTGVSYSLNLLG